MKYLFEIYLTKKKVSMEEWQSLIEAISKYNGFFSSWKILVIIDQNKFRFLIESRCSLPSSISNLKSFVFKRVYSVQLPQLIGFFPLFVDSDSNIINIYDYCEIKHKGNLKCVEIKFNKLTKDKIISTINLYTQKRKNVKKYKLLSSNPANILSIDFEGNSRFFYKTAPKYLDISKALYLFKSNPSLAALKVDTFPYLQGDFYLNQHSYSFNKHSLVIGSSGCGKSKFMSLFIENLSKNLDFRKKYKVVVIDPHASLENDIGGLGSVVDFNSIEESIDLFINSKEDVVSSTELLLELLSSLMRDQYNSKLERVLRHSIYLLLVGECFNFTNLRKVVLDLEYRSDLLKHLREDLPSSVVDFFLSDFNDLKTKSYGEAISPIIAFIDEMEMLPVFNNQDSSSNLNNIVNDNFLTLFSLNRTTLGDKVTKTISGLVMQQLFTLVQKHAFNQHIIFVIDEVAVVENPILARFLSEARKYNLSLILAEQYFSQISDSLRSAIFANVINYYVFRISQADANILVDNLNIKIPLDDTRERKIKLLTELNNREAVVRIDSNGVLLPVFKTRTLDFKSIPRIKRISQDKRNVSSGGVLRKKMNFAVSSNVNLKDILIANSSSRKVVKK